MGIHLPKFGRSTSPVGDTPATGSATRTGNAGSAGPSDTARARSQSSVPPAPRNSTDAARPSHGTSRLSGFKPFGTRTESLASWANHGQPGEKRTIAEQRIRAARTQEELAFVYGDFENCDLRGLGLKSLPVKSLLKIPADCKVYIDLAQLEPETKEALTAAVMKKGYDGPTFEPGPKNAIQRDRAAQHQSAQQARGDDNARFHQEQARESARASARARAAHASRPHQGPLKISVKTMAERDGVAETVEMLVANGFDNDRLQALHRDIVEYGSYGDINRGSDWFEKKYGTVFDQPISEAGALRNYSRLLGHLSNP